MIQHTLKGTVYGVILNDHRSLQKIGPLDGAPYQGAPQAPVLYLKPANTHAASGATSGYRKAPEVSKSPPASVWSWAVRPPG